MKSQFWSRIAYACGTFGHDFFYAMIGTYFMIFVTSNLFHSEDPTHDAYMIGIVTTIILVLRIGELFIDPFIGNTIDKTKTRWGKFKPWVIAGAFVAAITLAVLFTDMGGLTMSNPMAYLVAFAIIYLIMDVFYSAKDVAIWSMIPALSFDSHEREITATFARIGSVFGGQLVTILVMPIVLYFSANQNGGAGDPTGWFAFAAIGGGIATLGAIILGIGTKEQDSALRENKQETTFSEVFSILIKNDQLLWVACAYLVFGLGQNLINNLNLYYFIYVLGDASKFSFLGVINVIIGLLAVALFPTLTQKFSRRKLFFASISIMLVAVILYALAGTNVAMTLFAAGLFALPQPLIFLVVLMTITDTVEYGQLKLGHRDEALCLCVRPLVDKLAGAITSGIIGIVAIWVGMTAGATADTITPENLTHFKYVMFIAPFVFIVLGAILYRAKVTLTEREHARIVLELEEKWEEMNQ
ncbi:glycoside-pentoside-hexuronide (GPH):cation symporter [Mitsuokella sp. oral taxon 131]|uniref:glycoside-pentoside-hexuronide (GPH):cation symporter n=1 Tax=Mitsuokella sp. oral taxon 131 TaxID=1321780 RepID=UPI0003AE625E|nr:glycoside-pentoside-hexuronide (GPH):cation symporter [Mitsuokella sp. oral taxon 131]ERL25142.1 glycoside/pentoside/hexuronide transporter [Mitsuokella sp. oral taxon 131 str. W9106]